MILRTTKIFLSTILALSLPILGLSPSAAAQETIDDHDVVPAVEKTDENGFTSYEARLPGATVKFREFDDVILMEVSSASGGFERFTFDSPRNGSGNVQPLVIGDEFVVTAIFVDPGSGAGLYAVYLNDALVGYLTINADGNISFQVQ